MPVCSQAVVEELGLSSATFRRPGLTRLLCAVLLSGAQEDRLIKELASKSHKEHVASFNEKLAKLTEHHDLPKVGPG